MNEHPHKLAEVEHHIAELKRFIATDEHYIAAATARLSEMRELLQRLEANRHYLQAESN